METSTDNQIQNQQVRPLLHTNCLIGNYDKVLELIQEGADVNAVDFTGVSALQLCSAAGHHNIAKLLLASSAKPDFSDPLHGNSPLAESAWRGYSSLVKTLCNPETINKQNKGGFTPLHLSCQAGHNQSTRELLVAGADPNIVNTYGDSALHTAVRYGHAGVARILLSARSGPNIQNKNGDTPLHIASAMGRTKLTKILLSAGCRQDLKNHQRERPIDISERKEFEEVSEILRNPPKILTPIQRDELRASKYKGTDGNINIVNFNLSNSTNSSKNPKQNKHTPGGLVLGRRGVGEGGGHIGATSTATLPHLTSGGGQRASSRSHLKQNRPSGSKSNLKESHSHPKLNANGIVNAAGGNINNSNSADDKEPNWSPYGCHYHPNPSTFPSPNIDSLPKEPLTSGELYYLDLAGNIHKGPMGVSEGCYCTPILYPRFPNPDENNPNQPIHQVQHQHHHDLTKEEDASACAKSCHGQLKSLTKQLSKMHLDTMLWNKTESNRWNLLSDLNVQLSSLHTLLRDRMKEQRNGTATASCYDDETKLKEWVKQYRRFRKELSKNPKALHQASELLENANRLFMTRPPSPPLLEQNSDSDSGI